MKISKPIYLLPIVFLMLTSCNRINSRFDLNASTALKETFTEAEIEELNTLFTFFNRTICSDTQVCSECYRVFFEEMNKIGSKDFKGFEIPYDEQLDVMRELSDSLWKEIWTTEWSKNGVDCFASLYFPWECRYMSYLKKCAEKIDFAKRYLNAFEDGGGVVWPGMLEEYRYKGNESVDIHFIMAIHFLTLNDVIEQWKYERVHYDTTLNYTPVYILIDNIKKDYSRGNEKG